MKKAVIALLVGGCAGVASAGVVSIDNLRFNTTIDGTPTEGTLTLTSGTVPLSKTASPITLGVTWSGLNLDGIGGANDSITFDYIVTTSRDNFATTLDTRAGTAGWGVDGYNIATTDDLFRLSLANVAVSDDAGGSIVFDGFSQMNVRVNTLGTDMSVNVNGGTAVDIVNAAVGDFYAINFDLNTVATLGVPSFTDGNVRFTASDLQFSYTIPEPATMGLVAAMGGGLLFIRRRFMM